ncbi:Yip1 family protein [Bacillus haynesii]|uniref:Yip1 family protein n=1 Tax=Bacillus haynesii TaxID=1925021 RepID=UPI00227DD283|nr:Yip1 family protein [Bacillus haynesii]MCY7770593.1 YIP1 family protein [Bacillus haynesii]MEC0721079.1 Yip1 family protein [Bacillus haynesii]MEC0785409.1 Yip1 family protein [Bacillus haynesii]
METHLETEKVKNPSLLGLITRPGEQFERMREKPAFWFPLVIVLILSVTGGYMVSEKTPLSADLSEIPDAEAFQAAMKGVGIIGGIFGFVIALLISALIYWLIVKIGRGTTNFVQMFSLSVFTYFIMSIGQFIGGLVIYYSNIDPTIVVTSLNGIIPADEPLKSVLGVFDIFTIWSLALVALGLQKVGGISKKAAWTGVIILFVISILLALTAGMAINFFDSFEGAM